MNETSDAIHRLDASDYSRVKDLTEPAGIACAMDATLDGTCPGIVWVDNALEPSAALVDTPEGHYVVGDPGNAAFNRAVTEHVLAWMLPGGEGKWWWWFYIRCPTTAWADAMASVLPPLQSVVKEREFYACERVTVDWRAPLPDGYELTCVDAAFLNRDDVENLEEITGRAKSSFETLDRFLAKGFAAAVIHSGRIVSLCCADAVSGRRCEVGVSTDAPHRHRGLATRVVGAAVHWALTHGYESAGWHCLRQNRASSATARKVGFRKVQDYTAFQVCARPIDADVIRGNLALIAGDVAAAAERYGPALAAFVAEGQGSSKLLGLAYTRGRTLFQMASVLATAGQMAAATLAQSLAVEASDLRQGGF